MGISTETFQERTELLQRPVVTAQHEEEASSSFPSSTTTRSPPSHDHEGDDDDAAALSSAGESWKLTRSASDPSHIGNFMRTSLSQDLFPALSSTTMLVPQDTESLLLLVGELIRQLERSESERTHLLSEVRQLKKHHRLNRHQRSDSMMNKQENIQVVDHKNPAQPPFHKKRDRWASFVNNNKKGRDTSLSLLVPPKRQPEPEQTTNQDSSTTTTNGQEHHDHQQQHPTRRLSHTTRSRMSSSKKRSSISFRSARFDGGEPLKEDQRAELFVGALLASQEQTRTGRSSLSCSGSSMMIQTAIPEEEIDMLEDDHDHAGDERTSSIEEHLLLLRNEEQLAVASSSKQLEDDDDSSGLDLQVHVAPRVVPRNKKPTISSSTFTPPSRKRSILRLRAGALKNVQHEIGGVLNDYDDDDDQDEEEEEQELDFFSPSDNSSSSFSSISYNNNNNNNHASTSSPDGSSTTTIEDLFSISALGASALLDDELPLLFP